MHVQRECSASTQPGARSFGGPAYPHRGALGQQCRRRGLRSVSAVPISRSISPVPRGAQFVLQRVAPACLGRPVVAERRPVMCFSGSEQRRDAGQLRRFGGSLSVCDGKQRRIIRSLTFPNHPTTGLATEGGTAHGDGIKP